jgi:Secretion system C-terminal sorting domain
VFIDFTTDLFYDYDDGTLINGESYLASVTALYDSGESNAVEANFIYNHVGADPSLTPLSTSLHGNYPNPFNPSTTIRFDIKENERGRLTIFNLKGQVVASDVFNAGRHLYCWDGGNTSTGLYFYQLRTDSGTITKKMLMMK